MYKYQIVLSKGFYPSVAILKTSYMFLNQAYIHIGEAEKEWIVSLSPKNENDSLPMEFENELIAQVLREKIYQRTKTLREILFARAMTSTMIDRQDTLKQIEDEEADVHPTELDEILTDWFERYERNN